MKTRFSGILKWLALAGFLLAAGSFYSCGLSGSNGAGLVRAEENVEPVAQEEPAAVARQETATGGNTDETAPGVVEEREEITSAAVETTGAERTADAQTIYIYICGEILHPGVYRMAEGQRIFEVVEMAGGFTELAADSWLNLAEAVYDGMKIEVPNQNQVQDEAWLAAHTAGASQTAALSGAVTSAQSAEESGAGSGSGLQKVNINTATKEQLMTLTGIGEVKAARIVQYRDENGAFRRIEDITNVPGIKDAAFQKIKDDITI
ncbi:MAG: ComEA family DNA-binding protein [Clostridiales bacterium]|nr:ComEA family DNA-binding protein [Clostridiales bacterium]